MSYEQILYDVADSVATITLNCPDHLNAVTARSIDELIAAFDAADADDGVRAVIVTGAGRAFCAGADLGAGGRTFDRADRSTADEHRDGGGRVTLRIFDLKKPVIAAINGPAVGFGITLTLPMDVRIASTAARIGFVFARRGVVPEACSTWFLPRLVGMSQAAEWALTGRVFSAEEALAGRLVSRVVAPDALLATARELAREIADNTSAVSVALIRQMLGSCSAPTILARPTGSTRWGCSGRDAHPMPARASRPSSPSGRRAFRSARAPTCRRSIPGGGDRLGARRPRHHGRELRARPGRLPHRPGRGCGLGGGVLGRGLGGETGTPAPPVIVYSMAQGWTPRRMKANLQAFMVVTQALILGGYEWAGLLTREVWHLGLSFAIPALVGVLAGIALFGRIDAVRFRQIVFTLLFISGLVLLVRG